MRLYCGNFTPHSLLTAGSDQKLSHPGSNYKYSRMSSKIPESRLRCRSSNRSKWRFSFSSSDDHIGCLNCVHDKRRTMSIFGAYPNLIVTVTCMFSVSILNHKPCHTSLKYTGVRLRRVTIYGPRPLHQCKEVPERYSTCRINTETLSQVFSHEPSTI